MTTPHSLRRAADRRPGWSVVVLLCVLCLSASGGCNWQRWIAGKGNNRPLDPVFPETSPLAEVISQVNVESGKITSLQSTTTELSIKAAGWPLPTLKATLAAERTSRFRLIGELGMFGSRELDLGGNDDLFWFWVKRNQPPGVYFCRHDEFQHSDVRRQFPVEPRWVMETLGLAPIDPALPHEGPFPLGKGVLEIRTPLAGGMRKSTHIDVYYGRVVEQHLYDSTGALVASGVVTDFKTDPATGLRTPHKLNLSWPAMDMSLGIDLGEVSVNALNVSPDLWDMPQMSGVPAVNMMHLRLPAGSAPPSGAVAGSSRPSPPSAPFVGPARYPTSPQDLAQQPSPMQPGQPRYAQPDHSAQPMPAYDSAQPAHFTPYPPPRPEFYAPPGASPQDSTPSHPSSRYPAPSADPNYGRVVPQSYQQPAPPSAPSFVPTPFESLPPFDPSSEPPPPSPPPSASDDPSTRIRTVNRLDALRQPPALLVPDPNR